MTDDEWQIGVPLGIRHSSYVIQRPTEAPQVCHPEFVIRHSSFACTANSAGLTSRSGAWLGPVRKVSWPL